MSFWVAFALGFISVWYAPEITDIICEIFGVESSDEL